MSGRHSIALFTMEHKDDTDLSTVAGMDRQLHRMCAELPVDVRVQSVSVFAEDHGIASNLYRVKLEAKGDLKEQWDGKEMCVKWFDSAKFSSADELLALREIRMYDEIAPQLGQHIRLLHCYGSERVRDAITCIAFEFVHPPFHLGRQVAGLPLDEIQAAVRLVARMHSSCAVSDLPSWVQPIGFAHLNNLAETVRTAVANVTGEKMAAVVPGVDAVAAMPVMQAACEPGLWEAMADAVGHGFPSVFLHMDVRGENLFVRREEGEVAEMILFDWQNFGIGAGVLDLAYLLTCSVEEDVRRQYERQLIDLYVSELERLQGTTGPSKEEYWQRYRMALTWPLVWAVATVADLDPLLDMVGKTEPEVRRKVTKFMVTVAHRNIIAATDHNAPGLLSAHVAALRAAGTLPPV